MKLTISSNNGKIIQILNKALLWDVRDSLVALGKVEFGESIFNSGKQFLPIDPNDFRDTLNSIMNKERDKL